VQECIIMKEVRGKKKQKKQNEKRMIWPSHATQQQQHSGR
jgi:hypothetical protein